MPVHTYTIGIQHTSTHGRHMRHVYTHFKVLCIIIIINIKERFSIHSHNYTFLWGGLLYLPLCVCVYDISSTKYHHVLCRHYRRRRRLLLLFCRSPVYICESTTWAMCVGLNFVDYFPFFHIYTYRHVKCTFISHVRDSSSQFLVVHMCVVQKVHLKCS